MTKEQLNIITQNFEKINIKLTIIENKVDIILNNTNNLANKAIFTGDAGETLLKLQNDIAALKDEAEA